MEENKMQYLSFDALLFTRTRKNAVITAKNICGVYGNGDVAKSESIIPKCFASFRIGNSDLE